MNENKKEKFEKFYATKQSKLILLTKFYPTGSGLLVALESTLQEAKQILQSYKCDVNEIYCGEITDSMRHKNKWYFACDVSENEITDDCYKVESKNYLDFLR